MCHSYVKYVEANGHNDDHAGLPFTVAAPLLCRRGDNNVWRTGRRLQRAILVTRFGVSCKFPLGCRCELPTCRKSRLSFDILPHWDRYLSKR
jgi:hypothetical protein